MQELYIVMEGEVKILTRRAGVPMSGMDQSFYVRKKKTFKEVAKQVQGAIRLAKVLGKKGSAIDMLTKKSDTSNADRSLSAHKFGEMINHTEMRYPSEAFGEVSFFTEMPSPEGATTVEVTRVMVISKASFEGLSAHFPNATRAVLEALLSRTEEALNDELDMLAPEIRAAVIRKYSCGRKDSAKTEEDELLDLDLVISDLPQQQVTRLEMLSRINKAVQQHYEQLDLSRVSKFLNNVAKNNLTDVKLMLSQGLNPDASAQHDRRTALMIAASQGHVEMCELLLESGANPMARDRLERTALIDAVQAGHDDVMQLLRKHLATLKGDNLIVVNEMLNAVYSGDIVYLRRLLRAGADPDCGDYDARTALHIAASEGDIKSVRLLIEEAGATVDPKDRWGCTPYDTAVQSSSTAVIEYLAPIMEASVELRASSVELSRVSKWLGAASVGNLALVNQMLKELIDPELTCKAFGGRTALMLAAAEGQEEVVLRLLEASARVFARDDQGYTAMFHAAFYGRENIINLFLDRDIKINMNEQILAYHMCMAAKASKTSFLRCLILAGADPTTALFGASTPLHCAAAADCVKGLRVLVDEGNVFPGALSPQGITALEVAERAGATKAADYLRRVTTGGHLGSSFGGGSRRQQHSLKGSPVLPDGAKKSLSAALRESSPQDSAQSYPLKSLGKSYSQLSEDGGAPSRGKTNENLLSLWEQQQHMAQEAIKKLAVVTGEALEPPGQEGGGREVDWQAGAPAGARPKNTLERETLAKSANRRRSWMMLYGSVVFVSW